MLVIIQSNIYVDSCVHPGHVITTQPVDNDDIFKGRNEFVAEVNNVHCFFIGYKLNSSVVYILSQSYCMSLYGGELWLLNK